MEWEILAGWKMKLKYTQKKQLGSYMGMENTAKNEKWDEKEHI